MCLSSVSSAERQQVLGALERLQAKLVQREEWTHSETMGNLRETLQSPLFSHILTLQHSIKQLRNQVRNRDTFNLQLRNRIRSEPAQLTSTLSCFWTQIIKNSRKTSRSGTSWNI